MRGFGHQRAARLVRVRPDALRRRARRVPRGLPRTTPLQHAIHLIRGGHVPRRRARLLDPRGHRGGLLLPGGQDARGSMEPSARHRRGHAPRAGQRRPRRLRIPRSLLKVQRKRWIYKSWILTPRRRRLDRG